MVSFEKTALYKHLNNTDVAFRVLDFIGYTADKGYETHIQLEVEWYNIVNPNNVFYADVTEVIDIKIDDLHKWKKWGNLP